MEAKQNMFQKEQSPQKNRGLAFMEVKLNTYQKERSP
jgi:hypothetical protein